MAAKKKRSKGSIARGRAAIMKEADRLQKAGIHVGERMVVVGGAKPVAVHSLRKDKGVWPRSTGGG